MKVLFAASEFSPLIKVGGLADVVGSLPKALRKLGIDARVILPGYSSVALKKEHDGVPLYFIKSHRYFENIYPGGELESEQFIHFSKSVVDWLLTREFEPDLIHCHDYHTALIPDIIAQRGITMPTLLTVHDLSNTGMADASLLETPNIIKRGLYTASRVSTVSPTYAKEMVPLVGGRDIEGILNGIDYEFFNPKDDPFLKETLKSSLPAWKNRSKQYLQKEVGLKVNHNAKIIAMISRLSERKGVRLFADALEPLLRNDATALQVVVLGTGDKDLEQLLLQMSRRFANCKTIIAFDEGLAHRIYAGADFFCVPSLFEPCGLTQMIAMRYGTLPVVRNTGGLADSVAHLKDGFVFSEYKAEDLKKTFNEALNLSAKKITKIRQAAYKKDFSWSKSAKQYQKLYEKVVNSNRVGLSKDQPVIFAPLRMKRPRQEKAIKEVCLFCPGNEALISPGITSTKTSYGKWRVRVIPNKYPIFNIHEVIITTRKHGVDLINLTQKEINDVFMMYRSRAQFYEPENTLIYHNFGSNAGASILHSHSQLVIIPLNVTPSFPKLEKPPSFVIKNASSNFVAYCPKDSRWTWETVIHYKHKTLEFSKLRDSDILELASLFRGVLRSIYKNAAVSFDKWHYNFFITPGKEWQLRIIPRLEIPAGLELGSNIEVNTVPPDYAAKKICPR
ncbi:MAG: glycogen/starch synthase [bacterium]